jgi:hypothetical protein
LAKRSSLKAFFRKEREREVPPGAKPKPIALRAQPEGMHDKQGVKDLTN